MKNLDILLLEWKHFVRSPFKIIALVLFVVAGIYGLHKGANLYHKQSTEIAKIEERIEKDRLSIIDDHYRTGNLTPEDSPWINYSEPFWAVWFSSPYHFKKPSAAMVYSIGQSEQYGFYKRITFWASPYDADLAEEIANPERLQTGTLDFSFALLFLLPLVLLVLLYNLKSMETEQGFMTLIAVQMPAKSKWLFLRVSFYAAIFLLVLLALLLYGATLTGVLSQANSVFGEVFLYAALYLLFWSAIYFIILLKGKSILGNTLRMTAAFLLLAFIIPAGVHQLLSISKPTNLMTDFIDVRDQQEALYEEPDSLKEAKLISLFPEILNSPVYQDSARMGEAMNNSTSALVNELKKRSIAPVINEFQQKNAFIESTFWFNPVSSFQNRLNATCGTHFNNYQQYRDNIQTLIDRQMKMMVLDTWNDVRVDETKYKEYSAAIVVE